MTIMHQELHREMDSNHHYRVQSPASCQLNELDRREGRGRHSRSLTAPQLNRDHHTNQVNLCGTSPGNRHGGLSRSPGEAYVVAGADRR